MNAQKGVDQNVRIPIACKSFAQKIFISKVFSYEIFSPFQLDIIMSLLQNSHTVIKFNCKIKTVLPVNYYLPSL